MEQPHTLTTVRSQSLTALISIAFLSLVTPGVPEIRCCITMVVRLARTTMITIMPLPTVLLLMKVPGGTTIVITQI